MGSLLKMTFILLLSLLYICSTVVAIPDPRKPDPTPTDRPKDFNSTPKAKSTITTALKCYQDCSTSCDNDQCYVVCIDNCNSEPEGGKQPDTISATVACYQGCGTSCSDDVCYEQCVADCNVSPEGGKLPDNVASAVDCYEACGTFNGDSYEQCINKCNEDTDSGTGEEFPDFELPSNITDAGRCRLVCKFRCNPHHRPGPPHPAPPHKGSPHHPYPGHVPPHCSVRCRTSCYRSSVASGGFARQSDVEKDCTSTVIFTCDPNGENCVAGDSSYDCDDDTSGSRAPCSGLCRKRSVDGRCLKDTSCCANLFRGGPQFVACLIDN